jgi:uncharacterized protein YggE
MTKLLLALPLLAAACHERVIAVSPATPENPGLMTVTGSATLEVSPDCADLTMTLSSDNIRPGTATQAVDAKEGNLIAALTKQGVAPNDMKLSLVSLEPVYEQGGYPLVIHTYRAQITVTATTRDFAKISQLMEAGSDAGAIAMSSQFRRSDMPELKKKVRDMALAAAKDKAKQTATSLQIDLGRIVSVGENVGGAMWNQAYFPQVQNVAAISNSSGGSLGGTMQNLSLDVTIGYQLTKG